MGSKLCFNWQKKIRKFEQRSIEITQAKEERKENEKINK